VIATSVEVAEVATKIGFRRISSKWPVFLKVDSHWFGLGWPASDFQAFCMSQKAKIIIFLIFFDHFWVIAASVKVAEVTSKIGFRRI